MKEADNSWIDSVFGLNATDEGVETTGYPALCAACGHEISEHTGCDGQCISVGDKPPLLLGGRVLMLPCWCPRFATDYADVVEIIDRSADVGAIQRAILWCIDNGNGTRAGELLERYKGSYQADREWVGRTYVRIQKLKKEPTTVSSTSSAGQRFTHSDDYRAIFANGIPYTLTPNQAIAMKELWEHYQKGLPVSRAALLEAMETPSSRLQDSFRSGDGPKIWGTLLVKVRGTKDMYTLNLD